MIIATVVLAVKLVMPVIMVAINVLHVSLVKVVLQAVLDVLDVIVIVLFAIAFVLVVLLHVQIIVKDVQANVKQHIYQTIIPRSVRLAEAPSFGEPITVYDPKSTGAQAYRALAKEIAARKV